MKEQRGACAQINHNLKVQSLHYDTGTNLEKEVSDISYLMLSMFNIAVREMYQYLAASHGLWSFYNVKQSPFKLL